MKKEGLVYELIEKERQERTGKLDIGRCGLTEIPNEVFELVWLKELIVSNSYWDYEIRKWIKSKNKGQANKLSGISPSISNLINLKKLVLSGEWHNPWRISNIPFLEKLGNLQSLDLSWNHIRDIRFLEKLGNLQSLNLSSNQISDFYFLEKLGNLQSLDLSRNQISDIRFLEKLGNLQSLSLSYNKISNIRFLENLGNLQSLDLSTNQISDIRFLEKLGNLHSLKLFSNQISDICFLERLGNLQSLDLNFNRISNIRFLEKLSNLQSLDLSTNQISDIRFLEKLGNLQFLDLHSNQIRDITPLKSLIIDKGLNIRWEDFRDGISIENNPLIKPPLEIVKEGRNAVVNWFEQIQRQGWDKIYEAKVLFVGEPGAGKTTLMKKMLNPDFILTPEQDSTIGVDVNFGWEFKTEQNKSFVANLWDFGGQEVQFMFHQFFLTSGALYLLLTDNRKQNTHFNYWFNIIRLLGTDSKVIVVKNELKGQKITNFDEYNYRRFFPDVDFTCFNVDLDNNNDGRIKALTLSIQDKLQHLKHIGNEIPAGWPKVRKEIISRKLENYLIWDQFGKICKQHGIYSEEDRQYLLSYLHITGLVLYYQDDEFLSDTIFINPNWVFEAIYAVLKQDNIIKNSGKFEKQWIEKGWKNYSKTEKSKLFRLLLKDKFDVCYPLDHDEKLYMVPLLLPVQRQQTQWLSDERIHYKLEYEFLPYGLLSRLIVRLNDYIDNKILWKHGVLFRNKDAKALVTFNELTKRFIEIEMEGEVESRKALLDTILLGIEKIHERSFPNIKYDEKVQCNCSICKNNTDPHLFNVKTLTNWFKKGRTDAPCEKSNEDVPIQKLLDVVFSNEQISKRIMANERKGDTYFAQTINQISQNQEATKSSKQNITIGKNELKPEKKKSFWTRTWFVISAIVAFLAGLAELFGKTLSGLFGF